MDNTVTFISSCGKFQFTVKDTFFKRKHYWNDDESRMCSYEESVQRLCQEDVYCLMTKENMKNYLHSESQPAIVYLETKEVAFFKNGELLSKEEGQKMLYDSEFSNYVIRDLGL